MCIKNNMREQQSNATAGWIHFTLNCIIIGIHLSFHKKEFIAHRVSQSFVYLLFGNRLIKKTVYENR